MTQKTQNRILDWEGFLNARDLGGLPTRDGGLTRWGAAVRSDHPERLTAAGWESLYAHGIRTIIPLHTYGMPNDYQDAVPPHPDITTLRMDIEDVTDLEFRQKWASSGLWSTPLYYRDALERWPRRHAEALTAVARAHPGGVLFHCKRGVDRTGIIALLLLALVDVPPDGILADYELSVDPEREALLAGQGTTTPHVLRELLDWLDAEAYLRSGGMTPADLSILRERLLEP